jgi:hypothetical protein
MATPKGVRVRSTPDYFCNYLSFAGAATVIGPSHAFLVTALYNNSASGAYLYVYGLAIDDDSNTISNVYLQNGTFGSFANQGYRINPSIGAPPGQAFTLNNGLAPIPATAVTQIGVAFSSTASFEHPLFIIPPGWSLGFSGVSASLANAVTYWYVPFLDTKGRTPI